MGLKQIPQEEGTKTKRKNKNSKKQSLIVKIRKRLAAKEVTRDEKLMGKTCIKMVQYLSNGEEFNLDEIKDLLHGMERSILTVQRKKKKIINP